MSDIESGRYHTNLLEWQAKKLSTTNEPGRWEIIFSSQREYGEGTYWISAKRFADIKIHDFCFHKDSFFDFRYSTRLLGNLTYEVAYLEKISRHHTA